MNYGCTGCDKLTTLKEDEKGNLYGSVKCKEPNEECYKGNFIYVDGKKAPQPSEPEKE